MLENTCHVLTLLQRLRGYSIGTQNVLTGRRNGGCDIAVEVSWRTN